MPDSDIGDRARARLRQPRRPPPPLAEAFERERARLTRVAYATLGSLAEAEDVVQEAWLRLQRQEHPERIRDLRAWLTTTVGRLALDVLASARARRERYVGPWLPEPIVGPLSSGSAAPDPAEQAQLGESLSTALMIVLDRLSPPERAAFLLHDVFGMTFAQAAETIGSSEAAARQLASRGRRHVADARPRLPPSRERQQELTLAFAAACDEGDLEGLMRLMHPDIVWRADGGGIANAARRAHQGAEKVSRAMIALARKQPRSGGAMLDVNGMPGLVLRDLDGLLTVISLTIDAGAITAIDVMRNPEKLRHVEVGF